MKYCFAVSLHDQARLEPQRRAIIHQDEEDRGGARAGRGKLFTSLKHENTNARIVVDNLQEKGPISCHFREPARQIEPSLTLSARVRLAALPHRRMSAGIEGYKAIQPLTYMCLPGHEEAVFDISAILLQNASLQNAGTF